MWIPPYICMERLTILLQWKLNGTILLTGHGNLSDTSIIRKGTLERTQGEKDGKKQTNNLSSEQFPPCNPSISIHIFFAYTFLGLT